MVKNGLKLCVLKSDVKAEIWNHNWYKENILYVSKREYALFRIDIIFVMKTFISHMPLNFISLNHFSAAIK